VAYALEDGQLVRYFWLELDRAPQSEAQKQVLLLDVAGLDVEFMPTAGGSFNNQWPPLNANAALQATLPSAVSIKLTLKDWGDLTRIVEVAHPP
jgi:general secretion pathway protein J